MDNGVEIGEKPYLGEALVVEDGISHSRVGDRGAHGFHESKDSEGDVFEEAVDGHLEEIHMQEQPEKLDSEELIVNGNENVDNTGDSDSSEVSRSSSGGHFEEAMELPDEGQSREGEQPIVAEKLEDLIAAESVDEVRSADRAVDGEDFAGEVVLVEKLRDMVDQGPVDEIVFADGAVAVECNVQEVVPVESNGLDSACLIGNGEADVKEASATVADGERKTLMDGGEVEKRSDAVTEKSQNGHFEVRLEEISVVYEKSENDNVDMVESDKIVIPQGNESNEPILHQNNETGELNDSSTNLNRERHDHQSVQLKSTSSDQDTSINTVTRTPEIESPPPVEYPTTDMNEKIKSSADQDNFVNVENEIPKIDSPLHAEDSATKMNENSKADAIEPDSKHIKDSLPQQYDRNTEEGSSGWPEVKEPEELETQKVGQKHSLVENREPKIQPAGDVGSSAGNTTNPAPPPARPAGLGGAAPLLEPAPRAPQQSRVNGAVPQRQAQLVEDAMNGENEENDETREKLQMIRVKFLRLAHRLGQTPHNVVVAQVLYRLGLAEQLRGRNAGRAGAFSFDRASAMAEQLEGAGQEPLDFSCTIMVIGKTGVGKSATINSIFDEVKFSTDAFQMGTKKVQDVVGTVQGIKVRVIDTPGLLPSWSDQRKNEMILHSVKRFIKKTPPDIVLYLDRLDMQSRDFGDMPLLRTITEIFGPSIWFNAIVVLTHAASAPPDGPNGTASSYEMFVTQRSHVVQQAIRQAAGDMRLMNPVSLVENHSACRTNRAGQRVLPNGQVWKPHLLLLSFASKILAEANTLLKLQDSPPGKPFATRPRVPPLPFLLSSLLQSRPQLKLPEEQFGDDEDTLDEDLDEASDSDEASDYDELPPFKRLTKAQVAKLSKADKKAYFDELEYREKLFMKKQLKEERKRRKLLKKMAASVKDLPNDYNENAEEDSGGAASVPVPMPDLALPTSFDSDNPTHRYRYLDSSNQWLVRPVLETHGWDHDVGYEGINVERLFVVKDKIPLSFSGQVTKDKKESNLQMELASSIKHGEGKATSLGLDMQTVGKDMAYTLRSETRFNNFRHNNTAAGLSVTLLGDALSAGVKLEDKLIVNKRLRLVLTGGAMTGRGDVAYGGSLEATLRDKEYPLGRTLSTLGLSVMDWHGDLAIGCNVQSQLPIGRSTNLIARANLNNKGAGQVSIRLNSSEQLQIALIGFIPLFKKLLGYSQQLQFGGQ